MTTDSTNIRARDLRDGMVYRCRFIAHGWGEWRICLIGPHDGAHSDMVYIRSLDPDGIIHLFAHFFNDGLDILL